VTGLEQDGRIDVSKARRLIRERFPDLAGQPVSPLGAGTDHAAFDVGGRWVFRFPLHAAAGRTLAAEARLMEWLAPRLNLAVPHYRWLAVQPEDGTLCGGYERLPGTPALLVDARHVHATTVGPRLGAFLRSLHDCDPDVAARLGIPDDDDPAGAAWAEQAVMDIDAARDARHVSDTDAAWWRSYLAVPPVKDGAGARLIHGDFAAEHVLLTNGEPSGVIDWSDAVIGDPARDLAGLLHWGGRPMLEAAAVTYGRIDDAVLTRASWFAACRAVADIAFGDEEARPEYIAAGLAALRFLREPGGH
jgi:aminoglycoside phosphotransferase (APT) family kinase protein